MRVIDAHCHTQTQHILGRTPLEEGSVSRRDLYLYNTQHLQETNIHVPVRESNTQSEQVSLRRPTP